MLVACDVCLILVMLVCISEPLTGIDFYVCQFLICYLIMYLYVNAEIRRIEGFHIVNLDHDLSNEPFLVKTK